MANTLTNLIPDLYAGLDVVSRELVGFIPSVTRDATTDRAAVNQSVRSFVAPASTAADIVPATNAPDTGDQTIGNVDIKITKARAVPIRMTGEEELGLNNNGAGAQAIQAAQIQQAFRTLTNEVEADIAAQHINASRAFGTAGTTPFGTAGDYSDASQVAAILKANGAPMGDMSLVLDNSTAANLIGKQSRTDFQGSADMLRQGVLLDHAGLMIRESGQVKTHTAGTGASATTDNAGYAVGDTVITLASAGTGTVVAGDVVSFAGDSNKYVVVSGDTDVSDGGTITLAAPGLKQAIAASATAITVVGDSVRNFAFSRNALVLASRLPAVPVAGDSADDRVTIVDDRSGLAFEVAMYKEYRRTHLEVSLAWGTKMVKPEHTALLLG